MLDFIYDSLETVKNLKHPDKKMYLTLTIAIFAIVIVAGLYFVLADAIFGEGYQVFYQMMTEATSN
ncbi:MAG: preprotein translocase subunit SecE [Candidatus Peribacteria bacterium]|jgi:preprotein translocase subunit SecE|nr:preprotein translocase subunit SecE [Candidatus Peribacteria bacterium]